MLMAPTLVPVFAEAGVAGAEEGAVAVEPAGVAALPVWASAEIVQKTAVARKNRRSLLFIGSLELLETRFRE
jgi:hypothetical protein